MIISIPIKLVEAVIVNCVVRFRAAVGLNGVVVFSRVRNTVVWAFVGIFRRRGCREGDGTLSRVSRPWLIGPVILVSEARG